MPIRPNAVVYSFYVLAQHVLIVFQMVLAAESGCPLLFLIT
jgi:hypothetical protein